jgi:hypothetical protein
MLGFFVYEGMIRVGRKAVDITNMVFGRLHVIEQVQKNSKNAKWKCVCSCGKETVVESQKLRMGKTKRFE